MLAVRRSLRNSDRLIRPSLSMSASSSNGSMDPFKPVCCTSKKIQSENAITLTVSIVQLLVSFVVCLGKCIYTSSPWL
jgi:hypothetical protein